MAVKRTVLVHLCVVLALVSLGNAGPLDEFEYLLNFPQRQTEGITDTGEVLKNENGQPVNYKGAVEIGKAGLVPSAPNSCIKITQNDYGVDAIELYSLPKIMRSIPSKEIGWIWYPDNTRCNEPLPSAREGGDPQPYPNFLRREISLTLEQARYSFRGVVRNVVGVGPRFGIPINSSFRLYIKPTQRNLQLLWTIPGLRLETANTKTKFDDNFGKVTTWNQLHDPPMPIISGPTASSLEIPEDAPEGYDADLDSFRRGVEPTQMGNDLANLYQDQDRAIYQPDGVMNNLAEPRAPPPKSRNRKVFKPFDIFQSQKRQEYLSGGDSDLDFDSDRDSLSSFVPFPDVYEIKDPRPFLEKVRSISALTKLRDAIEFLRVDFAQMDRNKLQAFLKAFLPPPIKGSSPMKFRWPNQPLVEAFQEYGLPDISEYASTEHDLGTILRLAEILGKDISTWEARQLRIPFVPSKSGSQVSPQARLDAILADPGYISPEQQAALDWVDSLTPTYGIENSLAGAKILNYNQPSQPQQAVGASATVPRPFANRPVQQSLEPDTVQNREPETVQNREPDTVSNADSSFRLNRSLNSALGRYWDMFPQVDLMTRFSGLTPQFLPERVAEALAGVPKDQRSVSDNLSSFENGASGLGVDDRILTGSVLGGSPTRSETVERTGSNTSGLVNTGSNTVNQESTQS